MDSAYHPQLGSVVELFVGFQIKFWVLWFCCLVFQSVIFTAGYLWSVLRGQCASQIQLICKLQSLNRFHNNNTHHLLKVQEDSTGNYDVAFVGEENEDNVTGNGTPESNTRRNETYGYHLEKKKEKVKNRLSCFQGDPSLSLEMHLIGRKKCSAKIDRYIETTFEN